MEKENRKEGDLFHIRVCTGSHVARIGMWRLPSDNIDNFDRQSDIGWHIMFSMKNGADKVEVVMGDIE